MTPKETLQAAIDSLGLSLLSRFIPWSKSRNFKAGSKRAYDRSLNWSVTVQHNGRDVLTTDYGSGIAHCPAYKKEYKGVMSIYVDELIVRETETGKTADARQKPIEIDVCDVFYSLVLDSDAIEYTTFEDWADNLGYEQDSRSAEATYRQCLEIALKLRAAIGDAGLTALREAVQDY